MTERYSYNCIVCADEINSDELYSEALIKINYTKFKVCAKCLEMSNPEEDYKEVRNIVRSYLKTSSQILFGDAQVILNSTLKNKLK